MTFSGPKDDKFARKGDIMLERGDISRTKGDIWARRVPKSKHEGAKFGGGVSASSR